MEKISVEYQITVSDFRRATYYGLFLRHRTALRIMFVVLAVAVLYAIAGSRTAGGLCLVIPGATTDIIGIVLVPAVWFVARITRKKAATAV